MMMEDDDDTIYVYKMKERCSLVLFIWLGALLMRERCCATPIVSWLVVVLSVDEYMKFGDFFEIYIFICIYVVVHLVRCTKHKKANIFFVFLSNVTYGAHEHLQFGI